jgi:hypothetical protein
VHDVGTVLARPIKMRVSRTIPSIGLLTLACAAGCSSLLGFTDHEFDEAPRSDNSGTDSAPSRDIIDRSPARDGTDGARGRDGQNPGPSGSDGGSGSTSNDLKSIVESGSRLKKTYQIAPGGAVVFTGFYDTKIKEPCEFQSVRDGRVFCVPLAANFYGKFFGSAACSDSFPVVNLSGGYCSQSAFMSPRRACDANVGLYFGEFWTRPGVKHPNTSVYHKYEDGTCVPWSLQYYDVERLGIPVPNETFVRASLERKVVGPLTIEVFVAEDGARAPKRFLTTAFDVPCTFSDTEGAQAECTPDATTLSRLTTTYTDSSCATKGPELHEAPFPQPTPQPGVCPKDLTKLFLQSGALRRLDPFGAPTEVYAKEATKCVKRTIPSGYWVRDDFDSASIPRADQVSVGAGRIRSRSLRFRGLELSTFGLSDSELGKCFAGRDQTDGSLRCYPSMNPGVSALPAFTDAACTFATDAMEEPKVPQIQGGPCSFEVLGTKKPFPKIYTRNTANQCVEAPASWVPQSARTSVPPVAFAELSTRQD